MEAKFFLLPLSHDGSARAPCHGERCYLRLLLTPPKGAMIPPVPPAKSPAITPRLGCADAVEMERWDAHKNRADSPSPSGLRPASTSPRRTLVVRQVEHQQEEPEHHVRDGMADGRSHYRSWMEPEMMPPLCHL
jgi:hypothetical protein